MSLKIWNPAVLVMLFVTLSTPGWCETNVQTPATPSVPVLTKHEINRIDAEEFPVKVLKASKSGKVLMIEDPSHNEPRPGTVLLVKEGSQEILGLRVLKNYPGRFAGKIIVSFREFQSDIEYKAIRKIGDRILQRIKKGEKPRENGDIVDEELAKEIDPDDVELDRGIPKPEKKKPKTVVPEKIDAIEDDLTEIESDFSKTEEINLEPYNHILSLQASGIYSYAITGAHKRYLAVTLRYGYTFFRRLLRRQQLHDYFTAEGMLSAYRITNYETPLDEVTVIPFGAALRYSLMLTENITPFVYAGVLRQYVRVTQSSVSYKIQNLKYTGPMLGGGFLIRIGPGWAIRADIGWDMLSVGASLKF